MQTKDFLLELGTEEMPPKLLKNLSQSLTNNLINILQKLNLTHSNVESFATPRRLAVLIKDLQLQQEDKIIELKGPAVNSPKKAIEGFTRSLGINKSDLIEKIFKDANYYYFVKKQQGLNIVDLIEDIVKKAIKGISQQKSMSWGNGDFNFIRPVKWLITMLGDELVKTNIMGLTSNNITRGLRFSKQPEFKIDNAKDYQKIIFDKAKIEVDFNARKQIIYDKVIEIAAKNKVKAVIDDALLDEVCSLVEFPNVFLGKFDIRFLKIPKEVLISVMQLHQKYFHVVDDKGQLLPFFIAVANIDSNDTSIIKKGNERVITPRFNDAEFFWKKDKLIALADRVKELDKVLFIQSLGSIGDKTKRIELLSKYIANILSLNSNDVSRSALLAKADLVSEMVVEFPDLQGIIGYYYALNDSEKPSVAIAIKEHYCPKFSGDLIPSTKEGMVVAIADKIDTITGIYCIGKEPSGSKDPYALRRAALGIVRIIIEAKLEINIKDLISKSISLYKFDTNITNKIYNFFIERLDAYYKDKGIDNKIFLAVLKVYPESFYDFHLRIIALNEFIQNNSAKNLIIINKRIANILKKCDNLEAKINNDILVEKSEKALFDASLSIANDNSFKASDYSNRIDKLLSLEILIDDFFNNVMVNVEDKELKNSRLSLLNQVRKLFLSVADISYLA